MANRTKFTAKKRETFLSMLAEGWSVTKACRAIGISRRCAYDHRSADADFAAEWDAAWEEGGDVIEDEMLRRAVEGVEKPVYQGGVLVGLVQEYSDTLMIFALKGRKPGEVQGSRSGRAQWQGRRTDQDPHDHRREAGCRMSTLVRKLPQLYDITSKGEMVLHLHDGQWRAWESERRFIFMLAGTQGGKTSFGPHWLRREIERCGAGDYLAVTSTFPLLKLKMLPEFLRVFQHELDLGTWHGTDRVFTFHDGETRVIFGSATNSDSLESATAKGAWLDEVGQDDFRLESWEAIRRRLSLYQGQVLGGTTIYNLGWLKQMIYDRWRAGDEEIDIIQFGSVMNPAFPDEEAESAKRSLPTWKYNMFYRGMFTRPAGQIYGDFIDEYREEGGHKVRPFAIPPEWPRYGGLDFGGTNTARLMLARNPEANVYYLYDEYLDGGKTTGEHAADALRKARGVNMMTWHGGSKSETQQRMDWQAAGVRVQEPPVPDVEAGIDRVIALFKQFRMFIFDTCTGVLDEIGTYARELDKLGNPTEKIKDKATFHRLDALRYVVQALELPPAASVAVDTDVRDVYAPQRTGALWT